MAKSLIYTDAQSKLRFETNNKPILDYPDYTDYLPSSPAIITGTTSYRIPPHITSLQVQCWGSGGRGSAGQPIHTYQGGGGGGGGAYAMSTGITVIPYEVYVFTVATAGPTGSSSFEGENGEICLAAGGTDNPVAYAGMPGGLATNCIGDVKYSGGNGGGAPPIDYYGGGGGGGSAYTGSNGGAGGSGFVCGGTTGGGAGGVGTGAGGDGGRCNAGPYNGSIPGGAGGGAGGNGNVPGYGARGQIIITY